MKNKILLIAVLLQACWIVGTTLHQETLLQSPTTVLLGTRPVDPRDLLRGDYVILNYEVSRLSRSLFAATENLERAAGREVYVTLEQRGETHVAVAASSERPTLAAGQFLLRGRLASMGGRRNATDIGVLYGIERYYVPEGKGDLRGRITVEVALAPSGQPTIRQIFVDGKAFKRK